MCQFVVQIVKFKDCLLADDEHDIERNLRVDWVPNTVTPEDPCSLRKDEDGLCIEAKKQDDVWASIRTCAGCPLCGIVTKGGAVN